MEKIIVSYLAMSYGGFTHKHAQIVMEDLGIKYKTSIADSMSDCWQFYGCENIPAMLSEYVRRVEMSDWDYERSGLQRG